MRKKKKKKKTMMMKKKKKINSSGAKWMSCGGLPFLFYMGKLHVEKCVDHTAVKGSKHAKLFQIC